MSKLLYIAYLSCMQDKSITASHLGLYRCLRESINTTRPRRNHR